MFESVVDRRPPGGGPVVRVPFAAGGGGAAAGDGRVGQAADAANLGPCTAATLGDWNRSIPGRRPSAGQAIDRPPHWEGIDRESWLAAFAAQLFFQFLPREDRSRRTGSSERSE
jgi:hypothetical protein